MKRLFYGKVVGTSIIVSCFYFLAAYFLPMSQVLIALTGAAIGISVLIGVIYWPLFVESTKNFENRVSVLAIGMCLGWLSFLGGRFVSAFYRTSGQPEKLVDSPLVGYFILMGVISGMFYVAAPGYPPNDLIARFGGRHVWLIIFAVVAGALVTTMLSAAGLAV